MAAERTCTMDVLDKPVPSLVGRCNLEIRLTTRFFRARPCDDYKMECCLAEKMIDEERVIIEDHDLASKQLLKEKQLRGSPKVLNDHAIIIFWEDAVQTRASISITIISCYLFLPSAEVSRRLTNLSNKLCKTWCIVRNARFKPVDFSLLPSKLLGLCFGC